jgi:gas vesicle protein GvpA/GvpJ/GvpM family
MARSPSSRARRRLVARSSGALGEPPALRRETVAEAVLETPAESLLDLLDHLLNKGVMATGDVTLGVAGIDLIYLRLSTILCAADRVMPRESRATPRRARHRRPAPGRNRA